MPKKKKRKAKWIAVDKLLNDAVDELLNDKDVKRLMKKPYAGRIFTADGLREILPNGKEVPVPEKDKWMVGD